MSNLCCKSCAKKMRDKSNLRNGPRRGSTGFPLSFHPHNSKFVARLLLMILEICVGTISAMRFPAEQERQLVLFLAFCGWRLKVSYQKDSRIIDKPKSSKKPKITVQTIEVRRTKSFRCSQLARSRKSSTSMQHKLAIGSMLDVPSTNYEFLTLNIVY